MVCVRIGRDLNILKSGEFSRGISYMWKQNNIRSG